ncbi:glutamate--tRNA ligase [Actinopolymorpha sp. B11F2]|uniref:glutamate--tRNA ligase n=1 Tax=Actinopolymorpha sp. B11F2 TaxID=3160862 RepID=UPI0032E4EE0C
MAEGGSARPSPAVRTRFAPSPSGDLHVGNIRTALYAWAWARHTGGRFVLRIEDTDRSRITDEAIASALEDLRWLGLDWDEGPEIGGDCGPYQQSERLPLYHEWVQRFLSEGTAYHCYCTQEELDAERETQRSKGLPPGYSGRCRTLTVAQVADFEAEARKPVVRFRMPPGTTTVHDTIRGEVVFDHANIPDFVIMRANGYPLYNLAVSVDDALMRITHVVRGDDLLASTPRQIAMYEAMGVPAEDVPVFTHCPYVLGTDGKPLSKRYGSASIEWYRENGYLPEAVVNYLALLGWSPGNDREDLRLDELVELFDLSRVGATPGRLDPKKLDAINGDKIRALGVDELAHRIMPFLQAAGLVAEPVHPDQARLVAAAVPLIQERLTRLTESVDLLAFLFVREGAFTVDPEAAARVLTTDAGPVLSAAYEALAALAVWDRAAIEQALRQVLVEKLGRKPKHAFGPVRVAVTGRRVSPPLFESLELLGAHRTLGRIERALEVDVG